MSFSLEKFIASCKSAEQGDKPQRVIDVEKALSLFEAENSIVKYRNADTA
jgi:hypothetical protein